MWWGVGRSIDRIDRLIEGGRRTQTHANGNRKSVGRRRLAPYSVISIFPHSRPPLSSLPWPDPQPLAGETKRLRRRCHPIPHRMAFFFLLPLFRTASAPPQPLRSGPLVGRRRMGRRLGPSQLRGWLIFWDRSHAFGLGRHRQLAAAGVGLAPPVPARPPAPFPPRSRPHLALDWCLPHRTTLPCGLGRGWIIHAGGDRCMSVPFWG